MHGAERVIAKTKGWRGGKRLRRGEEQERNRADARRVRDGDKDIGSEEDDGGAGAQSTGSRS